MNGICLPRLADTLPAIVPDASDWTIDDVVKFFKDVGFTEQAEVFREQVLRLKPCGLTDSISNNIL